MKFINVTRIIAIMLLMTIAGGIYTARQYLNRDLISEAQNAMRDSLARFLTPEIKALAKAQAATRILQEEETQRSVIFWGAVTRYGTVGTLGSLLTAVLMLSLGGYYKLTTHRLKTRYSEIEYRGKLDPAVATGLVLAEQLESRSSEAAVNLYLKLDRNEYPATVSAGERCSWSGIDSRNIYSARKPDHADRGRPYVCATAF